ncbi:MAG: hypothetical protein NTV63_01520 [Candidatus Woesearchaeota archaeon]|nr:hypothetical protein [Candidatus Woesearchaeota archaeon]
MKKKEIMFNGIETYAYVCPKCKKRVFTEEMAMSAVNILESKRLKEEYRKRPIKIGHSWGVVFPKDVAEFFSFDSKDAKIVIMPNIKEKRVEIIKAK